MTRGRGIRGVEPDSPAGTPTVIVNGWLLRGGVDVALLDPISEQFLGDAM